MSAIKKRKIVAIVVAIIIFLLFQNAYYEITSLSNDIEIVGTDTYMRLVRVTDLHESKDWYDSVIDRNNAPYGDDLHWTRAFDIVIYVVVLLLMPFLGFTKALYITGIVISVILGCLSFICLTWMSDTILNENNQRMLYLLFLTQLGLLVTFRFGRPDHHSLLLLVFIIFIGGILRVIQKNEKKSHIEITGLFMAIGIWISVESLVFVIMAFMTLSILWIFYEEDYGLKSLKMAKSLTIYSLIILIIERPIRNILVVEYDKISIVYIIFFALITCIYFMVNKIYLNSKEKEYEILKRLDIKLFRLILLGVIGLIGAIVLVLIYPSFIKGPFADVNPEIVPIWLSRVNEVQPIFSFNFEDIGTTILHLGFPLVSLIFLIVCFRKNIIISKKNTILFGIGMLLYLPLTLYQIRWVGYIIIISLIPGILLLEAIIKKVSSIKIKFLAPVLRVLVITIFLFGFTTIGFIVMSKEDTTALNKNNISVEELCYWINDNEPILGNNKTILGFMDFGPEILYRTNHSVIAGPYHRNDEGILFNYNTMTSRDETYIIKNLLDRKVDWILIAPDSKEKLVYSIDEEGDMFYNKLINKEIPDWLIEIELPTELQNFILFEVDL